MKYNFSEIADQDQSLEKFIKATSNITTQARELAPSYEHIFTQLNRLTCDFILNEENVSPLECTAMLGSAAHIRSLLNTNQRYSIGFLKGKNEKLTYQKQAAFFRALEKGNIEVANFLLNYPEVLYAAKHLTIKKPSEDLKTKYPFLNNMIKRISCQIFMNRIPQQGNLALILAAKSGDVGIFNRLLNTDEILDQLSATSLQAFISIARSIDSETADINSFNVDILFQLIDIPKVHAYAQSRTYDFETLLIAYNNHINPQLSAKSSDKALDELFRANSPSKLSASKSSGLFASPATTVDNSFSSISEEDDDDLICETPVIF